jgi:hypothetical protein
MKTLCNHDYSKRTNFKSLRELAQKITDAAAANTTNAIPRNSDPDLVHPVGLVQDRPRAKNSKRNSESPPAREREREIHSETKREVEKATGVR